MSVYGTKDSTFFNMNAIGKKGNILYFLEVEYIYHLYVFKDPW